MILVIALAIFMAMSAGTEAGPLSSAGSPQRITRMNFTGGQSIRIPQADAIRKPEGPAVPPAPGRAATAHQASRSYDTSKLLRLQPTTAQTLPRRHLKRNRKAHQSRLPTRRRPARVGTAIPFVADNFPPWAVGAFTATRQ